MRSAARIAAVVASAVLLILPGDALADDAYVDADAGSGVACTMAQPCAAIQAGINVAGAGDTVFVDGGVYAESTVLGDDKSLVHEEFVAADGDSEAIIDGGASRAIEVMPGDSAGTVEGFTIHADGTAIDLEGPATITGNTIDDPVSGFGIGVLLLDGSGGASITGNTFTDTAGDTDEQTGVDSITSGSPTISGNQFENLRQAVRIVNGSPTVSSNTITGIRLGSNIGIGVSVSFDATATIVANAIHNPAPGNSRGIAVFEVTATMADTGATLRRNEIHDHTIGVEVRDTTGDVTLNGDVISGGNTGIFAFDDAPTAPDEADVDVTNVTSFDNGSGDVQPNAADVAVDSSILGPAGILDQNGAACSIEFSRGPVINPGGSGCDDFQTTAAPQFVNPGADNYHLQSGSPMIDAGNLANPGFVLDLDGDPRAVDATPACSGNVRRRDIGADEFVPTPPNCEPPPPAAKDTDPPETTLTRKPKKRVKTRKRNKKAKFRFESDEPGSSFECRLETIKRGAATQAGDGFEPCDSPFKRKVKARRKHEFQVRAIDPAANVDPTPASHRWKVKGKRR